jgi:CBS-domain-containing membrane protein
MKVSDILRVKGGTLFTVSPEQPLAEAVQHMAEHDIGSLVVMEPRRPGRHAHLPRGDPAVVRNGGSRRHTPGALVMDDAPLTCTPETEIDEVRRMMLGRHARYMPVLNGKHADGRDLVLRRGQGGGRQRRTSRTACSRPTSATGRSRGRADSPKL